MSLSTTPAQLAQYLRSTTTQNHPIEWAKILGPRLGKLISLRMIDAANTLILEGNTYYIGIDQRQPRLRKRFAATVLLGRIALQNYTFDIYDFETEELEIYGLDASKDPSIIFACELLMPERTIKKWYDHGLFLEDIAPRLEVAEEALAAWGEVRAKYERRPRPALLSL